MVWRYSIQQAVVWSGPVPEDPLHYKLVYGGPVQAQLGDEGSHSYTHWEQTVTLVLLPDRGAYCAFFQQWKHFTRNIGNKFVPCWTACGLKTEFHTGNIVEDNSYQIVYQIVFTVISWSTEPNISKQQITNAVVTFSLLNTRNIFISSSSERAHVME